MDREKVARELLKLAKELTSEDDVPKVVIDFIWEVASAPEPIDDREWSSLRKKAKSLHKRYR